MPVGAQDGKIVLDFGCGPGHDLVGFATASRPARLIGIDVSPSSIAEARERLSLHQAVCEFIQLDPRSTQLPLAGASVDYVHSSGVLHHLPDASPLLREFRRVLRPSGSARIMIYNHDSVWMHLFVAYMKRIVEKAHADLTLEQAFGRTTDGEDCPIAHVFHSSRVHRPCSSGRLRCGVHGRSGVDARSKDPAIQIRRHSRSQDARNQPKVPARADI